ncbi:hypothetical protein V1264_016757 [Littorina saxatilis]|uniref:Uncharacterized protein n=1 Tax=Littorina saxatilis TaxID=31220 RepID=A0AAN9GFY9_9CAEN
MSEAWFGEKRTSLTSRVAFRVCSQELLRQAERNCADTLTLGQTGVESYKLKVELLKRNGEEEEKKNVRVCGRPYPRKEGGVTLQVMGQTPGVLSLYCAC